MDEKKKDGEDPMVFRVAQLPGSGGPDLDRRTFVKGTIAVVGAGAMMNVLGGCGGDDNDDKKDDPCEMGCACHTVCPCEAVGGCTCDEVETVCNELPGEEGSVDEGDTGINVTTPTGETRTLPCGSKIPDGWICTCNCVTVPESCSCNKDKPKPTPTHPCTCQSVGHYWYPC